MDSSRNHARRSSPSGLNDPVAELTDWNPMTGGGSSFQMLELVDVSGERIEFRRTRAMVRFYSVLIGTGLVLLGLAVFAAFRSRFMSAGDALYVISVLTFLGLLVAGIGIAMRRTAGRVAVLDRRLGWYWKGKAPRTSADIARRNDAVLLKDIHAVQLLSKRFERHDGDTAGSSDHTSYEINLVMHNGSRVNVCNHGGWPSSIFADATRLGRFVDVPVWDAS